MCKTYWWGVSLFLGVLIAGCASTRPDSGRSAAYNDPTVVAVIAGEPVTLSEFERRYAKSVGGEDLARQDSVAAYEDFLQRYVDYRLKVRAGVDARLPEMPDLRAEIESYRQNFARPYLLEQEVLEPVIREVYERQRETVRARHILVRVDEGAAPDDTLRAYRKLAAVLDSVSAGADFGEMAFRHSEDPSAQREEGQPGARGDLSYFSAGMMVEPFESHAYGTPVGEVSPIFRTSFGYHILEVTDKIETPSPIRLSHIVLDASMMEGDSLSARERITDIYNRLQAGEDFATLAEAYSHDQNSSRRGGDIGFIEFSSRIIPVFKDAAFSLEQVGDVSEVVEAPYGFHLIKLTERQAPQTFEEAYPELKQRVARMPRVKEAEQELAERLREELGARVDTVAITEALSGMPATEFAAADALPAEVMQRHVVEIDDITYTIGDLAEHRSATRPGAQQDAAEYVLSVADDFLTGRAFDAGATALEASDREFGELMQEFRDGLVLFRFMEDSVWTAASQDTVALEALFDENEGRFNYPDRMRIITVSATADSTIRAFTAAFDDSGLSSALASAEGLRVDTMLVADAASADLSSVAGLDEGSRTSGEQKGGRHVVYINDGIEAARAKTFEEATPELVTMYQEVLERRVLEQLRQRYDVRLFPERLDQAFRSSQLVSSAGGSGSN